MRDTFLEIALALIAAGGLVLLLPACTDIEKCKIGTEGCVCAASGSSCAAGLQCSDGYCQSGVNGVSILRRRINMHFVNRQ